jgi:hypothetical protein
MGHGDGHNTPTLQRLIVRLVGRFKDPYYLPEIHTSPPPPTKERRSNTTIKIWFSLRPLEARLNFGRHFAVCLDTDIGRLGDSEPGSYD